MFQEELSELTEAQGAETRGLAGPDAWTRGTGRVDSRDRTRGRLTCAQSAFLQEKQVMDLFMILTGIITLMAANLKMCHCADSALFPPLHVTLSTDLRQQRVSLEWNASHEAHNRELKMLFQIEVGQTEKMTIIWTGNYSTTLTKAPAPLKWSWDSDLPLECVSLSLRIRSIVDDERFPDSHIWSKWSPWNTVWGLETSNWKQPVFPNDKTVEKGSNISFCCIAGNGLKVINITYNDIPYPLVNLNNRTTVITVKNVSLSTAYGTNIICLLSNEHYRGTVLFVSTPPDKPKNLSCETQDLKTLSCKWSPGKLSNLSGARSTTYSLSEWHSNTTFKCSSRDSCSWNIDSRQNIYNFTLTAENLLGKRHANLILDVTHKVHPISPTNLTPMLDSTNATWIQLCWSMQSDYKPLKLLCQIEARNIRTNEIKLHNTTTEGKTSSDLYLADINGLHPFTNYTLRIRCGTAVHFWKWSDWSGSVTFTTREAVPALGPDFWREVNYGNGGRNVTLYWKPLTDSEANGNIIFYNITWEALDANVQPENKQIPPSLNRTRIFLDTRPYRIRIVAINAVSSSPASELRIPGVVQRRQAQDDIKEERVTGSGNGIHISWKPSPTATGGYVVDWCNYPRTPNCDFQWKKYSPGTSSAVIQSDHFHPGIQYKFRVYASYADGERLMEKKTGYSKELAPVIKDSLSIVENRPNSFTLTWDQYSNDETQRGFISGYHLYLKSKQDACHLAESETIAIPDGSTACKFTIRNPEENIFTVRHLKPKTKYSVALVAVTAGGESSIDFSRDVETIFDSDAVILAVLLPLIIGSVTAMVLLALGFWKRKWLKDILYPQIPDPNKSKIMMANSIKVTSVSTVLNPEDCIPQKLEVVKRAAGGKPQSINGKSSTDSDHYVDPLSEENLNFAAGEISASPGYISFEKPHVEVKPTTPGTDARCSFENLTYASQDEQDPLFTFFEQETSETNNMQIIPGSLYQPQIQLQPYTALTDKVCCPNTPSYLSSIGDVSMYVGQTEVPFCKLKEMQGASVEDQCSSYKAQPDFKLERVQTVTGQDSSSEASPASTHSDMFLL
ncbi:oncostatin-M-specific receptor subunit beta [Lissotriton helveticus]